MRIFTFLFAFVFAMFSAGAQVVLVNSPASIAGPYNFSAAQFGADLTTGVWTGDAVFVEDNTADPNQGCDILINGAAVAGKIALIDRGSCEFGVKCLNAETAGAIAVVVFNNAPGAGTLIMAAGAVGEQVTIPCVMLSYEDGQTIRAILANEPVNISIGAIKFNNDVAIDARSSVARPPYGTIPASQVAGGYTVPVGAEITNNGLNIATNVTVAATITKDGNEVYNESGSYALPLEPDSSVLLGLPDYDAGGEGVGEFVMDYTISSDSTDELAVDNAATTSFYFSNNVYSKAGWDVANQRPLTTSAFTVSGGGNIEFLAGIEVPDGVGMKIDSIQFLVSVGNGVTLADVQGSVTAFVYEWDDIDGGGGVGTNELTLVALTNVVFDDPAATSQWVKVPVLDFSTFEEGLEITKESATYFVGVRYEGAELVFFGFDQNFDQRIYTSFLAQSDLELPYIGVTEWVNNIPNVDMGFLFTDFFGSSATAVYINSIAGSANDRKEIGQVEYYPNPASIELTVEVTLPEITPDLEYFIRDAAGRLVRHETAQQVSVDKTTFDVSDLPVGQYFLILETNRGSSARTFSIQR